MRTVYELRSSIDLSEEFDCKIILTTKLDNRWIFHISDYFGRDNAAKRKV